jgi:hypothetical protein
LVRCLIAVLLSGLPLLASGRADAQPIVDIDEREGAASDPRLTLARVQSDLERIAAGAVPRPAASGPDRNAVEAIVEAYRRFLAGDTDGMDAALGRIGNQLPPDADEATVRYFDRLGQLARDRSALVRLLAGLRRVDGTLFLLATIPMQVDIEKRRVPRMRSSVPSPLNGTWLRLPCRTVIGRAAEFTTAAEAFGQSRGPFLSCPADNADFGELERLAGDPDALEPKAPRAAPVVTRTTGAAPAIPPQPWDRAAAVAFMADVPDGAAPILEKAASLDAVGKLDYALFLDAFRPASPARDGEIRRLLAEVVDAAMKAVPSGLDKPSAYDGSDQSIVPVLVLASLSGVANTDSAFYAIPCAVLAARPALLEATKPQFGSSKDNFLPRSGCSWGRGTVSGFPEAEVDTFITASTAADGDFIARFDGTLKYGLESAQAATYESMKLDPRSFLGVDEPSFAYPYQTWGYGSLNARAVSLDLQRLYDTARASLAAYYAGRGLTAELAARAAKTALFAAVWGADCGGAVPSKSLRGLLLDGAAFDQIESWLASHGVAEAPQVLACADDDALDPLLHIAVATPAAVSLLLPHTQSVDQRNAIGKTALMVAAQFDQLESARLLIAATARVNASTWQQGAASTLTLSHDARTPLMYAAANASLPLIKLLLANGADPYQADTKGRRAIDYLLGFGPTSANARLSPEERMEAQRLLF